MEVRNLVPFPGYSIGQVHRLIGVDARSSRVQPINHSEGSERPALFARVNLRLRFRHPDGERMLEVFRA